jgi:hypothetical protein
MGPSVMGMAAAARQSGASEQPHGAVKSRRREAELGILFF